MVQVTHEKKDILKWNQADIVWFLYFTVMFNFYTNTYIQLISQVALIGYTLHVFICNRLCIKKIDVRRITKYLLWFGGFTIWCIVSERWRVYPKIQDTNTLLTIIRICIMGVCLVFFISDENRLQRIVNVLIHSGALFVILTIIINPISVWGKESFQSFGDGFMRNGIANFSLILICFTYFNKDILKKWKFNLFNLIFLSGILICGSRRAVIQLALAICLYTITEKNIDKKLRNTALIIMSGIIIVVIAVNIPFLRDTYIVRIVEMLKGEASTDGSTIGRNAYIIIGMNLFYERPLLGWGIDGFYNYLLRNPYAYASNFYLHALYSHNNYVEILSCFGIVGLILFYNLHIRLIICNWKYRKSNQVSRILIIIVALYLFGDYGGIVFSTHISIYFLIILLCMNEIQVNKRKMMKRI